MFKKNTWRSLTFSLELNLHGKAGYDHSTVPVLLPFIGLTSSGMDVSKGSWDFLLQMSIKTSLLLLLAQPWLCTQEPHLHWLVGGSDFPCFWCQGILRFFFCVTWMESDISVFFSVIAAFALLPLVYILESLYILMKLCKGRWYQEERRKWKKLYISFQK